MKEIFKLKSFTYIHCVIHWERNDVTVETQSINGFEITLVNQSKVKFKVLLVEGVNPYSVYVNLQDVYESCITLKNHKLFI